MNDHYIFVNKQSLIGGVIRFKFPYNDMSRVPNMSIKLIQGTVAMSSHLPDGLICKMSITASNYSSDDNKGATLGHLKYDKGSAGTNTYAYLYRPMEPPTYNIGANNTFIELSLNMSSNEIKQKLIDGLKHKSDLKQMNENVYKNISNFSIQDNYWDNLKIIVNKIEVKLNDDEYIAFNNGWSKKENIMISLGETYLKKSKLHSKDTDPNKLIKVLSGEQVKYIRGFDRNYSVVTQIHKKI